MTLQSRVFHFLIIGYQVSVLGNFFFCFQPEHVFKFQYQAHTIWSPGTSGLCYFWELQGLSLFRKVMSSVLCVPWLVISLGGGGWVRGPVTGWGSHLLPCPSIVRVRASTVSYWAQVTGQPLYVIYPYPSQFGVEHVEPTRTSEPACR